jgi:hypothetical protein
MTVGVFYEDQPEEDRAAIEAMLRSGAINCTYLLELDFASGPVRYCDRAVPVVDKRYGHTWNRAPSTAEVEDITAEDGNRLTVLRIYSLGIPKDMQEQFAGEVGLLPDLGEKSEYEDRAAIFSLQLLQTAAGPHGEDMPLGYPIVQHTGKMKRIVGPTLGRDEIRFEMHVEGDMIGVGTPSDGLLTDADQQTRFPGDQGGSYIAELLAKTVTNWPKF